MELCCHSDGDLLGDYDFNPFVDEELDYDENMEECAPSPEANAGSGGDGDGDGGDGDGDGDKNDKDDGNRVCANTPYNRDDQGHTIQL